MFEEVIIEFPRSMFNSRAHIYSVRIHKSNCIFDIIWIESSRNNNPSIIFCFYRNIPMMFLRQVLSIFIMVILQEKAVYQIISHDLDIEWLLQLKLFNHTHIEVHEVIGSIISKICTALSGTCFKVLWIYWGLAFFKNSDFRNIFRQIWNNGCRSFRRNVSLIWFLNMKPMALAPHAHANSASPRLVIPHILMKRSCNGNIINLRWHVFWE